jgi:hypothetical protein
MCGGGFAVFAYAAFALRKRRIQKIFLERRDKKKTGERGSARLPAQAAGRERGRQPGSRSIFVRGKVEGKNLLRKEVWK